MNNELEKTFFNTFGIEPNNVFKGCTLGAKYYSEICKEETCKSCDCEIRDTVYPQITDSILLELIFILTTLLDTTVYEDVFITVAKNREELKKDIFQECMLYKQHIKHKVRTLFKEGN